MADDPCTTMYHDNSTWPSDWSENQAKPVFLEQLERVCNPTGGANTSIVLIPPAMPFETIDTKTMLHRQYFFYQYWWLSIPISIVYLLAINLGQNYMKNRPPMQLRKSLIAWNLALCLFSMLPALRAFPFHVSFIRNEGLMESVCFWNYNTEKEARFVTFWIIAFAYSKVAELFDTAFIVLRKRPLIFLHWYHHVTVLWFVWFAIGSFSPVGGYFFSCNCFIHFLMYGYYALRAADIRVPKIFQITLTTLQILQMIFGMIMTGLTFKYKLQYGDNCNAHYSMQIASVLMYLSYCILFSAFFYKTYVKKERKSDVFTPAQLIACCTKYFTNPDKAKAN